MCFVKRRELDLTIKVGAIIVLHRMSDSRGQASHDVLHVPRGAVYVVCRVLVAQIVPSPYTAQTAHASLFGRHHCFRLQTVDGLVYFGARHEADQIRWMAAFQACPGCFHRPDESRVCRGIDVSIMEAKGLPQKPADYVCTVLVDGELHGRTRVKSNTETPFWGETLRFDRLPAMDCILTVQVSRVATGILRFAREASAGKTRGPHSHVDVVGRVDTPICQKQEKEAQNEKWVSLLGLKGASIRMRVRCTDNRLLPQTQYADLSQFFEFDGGSTHNDMLLAMQSVIKSGERSLLCQTLLRCSPSLAYLLAVCRMEINNTSEENVLFRGNSLASCSVDQFMKILAINRSSYLENTLAAAVQSIYDSRVSCEVDPTRGGDQHAMRKLQTVTSEVLAVPLWPFVLLRVCLRASETGSETRQIVFGGVECARGVGSIASLGCASWRARACVCRRGTQANSLQPSSRGLGWGWARAADAWPYESIFVRCVPCMHRSVRVTERSTHTMLCFVGVVASSQVWHAIRHSALDVPADLRILFSQLQALVYSRFKSQAAKGSVVTGFFFLRLMCPAILGPQLFGLQQHYPEGNTARTLTLVSKCIQNLANGVPFGLKEPYLLPMNSFLESNRSSMATCIEDLSSPPAAGGDDLAGHQLDLGPVDRLQALATLHKILADNLPGLREDQAQTQSEHVGRLIAVVEHLDGLLDQDTQRRSLGVGLGVGSPIEEDLCREPGSGLPAQAQAAVTGDGYSGAAPEASTAGRVKAPGDCDAASNVKSIPEFDKDKVTATPNSIP